MIYKKLIETYQGLEFMPKKGDLDFYFQKSFRPGVKNLYMPEKSYKYYGIPALGGLGSLGQQSLDIFKDLANIGLTVYGSVQQNKIVEQQIKAQQEIERIRAEALKAVANQRAQQQVVVQPLPAAAPPLGLIIGGTAFIAVVGGLMFFLTKK